ncbi:MAG: YIP1 family protein [Oscillospiraceae bacterium]|nr:YIP1 family protein [Oscillospiraceae bacterium]
MKTSFAEMSKFKYPFYIMFHPFDGFAELKYNKKGSVLYAAVLLFLWYVIEIMNRSSLDFAFNSNRPGKLDIRMVFLMTIAVFLLTVISNWCFSTFMDGKGTLANIFTAGAYCLIPMMGTMLICIILSKALVTDEAAYINAIALIGKLWTGYMIIAAITEIHDFNFGQTVAMICLTVLGLLIMLFLGFLVYSLVQQVIMFAVNITYEIIYRITMS